MMRLALDENFNYRLIQRLRQYLPGLDVVRVQDAGMAGASDPVVLEWAAQEGRILFTHDVSTMVPAAHARVAEGLPMPGVFMVHWTAPLDRAVEDLRTLVECSFEGEWENRVEYVPL
jgi:hypothetical protein